MQQLLTPPATPAHTLVAAVVSTDDQLSASDCCVVCVDCDLHADKTDGSELVHNFLSIVPRGAPSGLTEVERCGRSSIAAAASHLSPHNRDNTTTTTAARSKKATAQHK